ncbi:Helicase conserved C-terminal domain-containing protein [Robiginitalea myxolifaciens]|uniref:Helicase conserved C-terminal domain-containing protein n=1 Tax=Robiginitalea myxolifaciens TaxID=400055 RepID=A0A1I6G167_9FLAO|nr:helicase-related protein [Robiginitalea myxolifaciens]SFR35807.1 Helicase conserved C-terminal domain-containing protein [Robiginitalea myxolifaciens]
MSKTNKNIRDEIKSWVERAYLGPFQIDVHGNPDLVEELSTKPRDLYTTGILYPQVSEFDELFQETEETLPDSEDARDNTQSIRDSTSVNVRESTRQSQYRGKSVEDDDDNEQEEELRMTTEFNPSSIAISMLVNEDSVVNADFACGKYSLVKNETGNTVFKRSDIRLGLDLRISSFSITVMKDPPNNWEHSSNKNQLVLNDDHNSIRIKAILRKQIGDSNSSYVLTLSIINPLQCSVSGVKQTSNCVFQPSIEVRTQEGFLPFPDNSDLSSLSKEEVELKFLYRNYKNYGMGHGCAVDWNVDNGKVSKIFSSIIPTETINGVDFEPEELSGVSDVLFMKNLTDCDPDFQSKALIDRLEKFVSVYDTWIDKQQEMISEEKLNSHFQSSADNLLIQCTDLSRRMKKGITLLRDPDILRAFLDANKAMFYQRIMGDFSSHRRQNGRVQHNGPEKDDPLPQFDQIPKNAISGIIWENGAYKEDWQSLASSSNRYLAKWRPFQLAFILSQLEGITDDNSSDRNTVDLLWFATGGGKTEAYLGLIAFTIFYTRITSAYTESGVTVMMRYTLRMLNKQQFSRANILVCACELIRKRHPDQYGSDRISNGLWVGKSLSPNKHHGSTNYPGNNELMVKYKTRIENLSSYGSGTYSPAVFSCPCCGNKLVKEIITDSNGDSSVVGRWGYHQMINPLNRRPFGNDNPFHMVCTNTKCYFHVPPNSFQGRRNDTSEFIENVLPIHYVDESIYQNRPTLLFSTVDKYAQLAWKNECFRLFNLDDQFERMSDPPKLIIQDELHLISSSLGTIYSLFEFAIDELCKSGGISPKIVTATATVRNAMYQCIKIYDRKSYRQFPPSGITIDDAFFSRRKQQDEKARLYVGIMSSGFTSTTAKLRLDSVIQEGVNTISGASSENLDNYYTLLAYFNTVKELGKYRTLLEDDIKDYRKFLSNFRRTFFMDYNPDRTIELSSQMTGDDINRGLEALEKVRLHKIDEEDSIVFFLNSLGIRSIKDMELTRMWDGSWNWKWLRVIRENWEFLEKECGLSPDMFVDQNVNSKEPEQKERIKRLLDHCCGFFAERISSLVDPSNTEDPIKIAMSTNMISVGVDIPRLNVMSISGQPKTTAEYIQASSRVGREVPGIVFTLYNPAKNRDRSHYENFKDYHQAYYRYVESTSVTPFSLPALEKVTDSIVIALMRAFYFKRDDDAYLSTQAKEALEEICNKMIGRFLEIEKTLGNTNERALVSKRESIERIFSDLKERWENLGHVRFTTFQDMMRINQLSPDNIRDLLFVDLKYKNHPVADDKLFAMTSLRDVETTSRIRIKSYIE